MAVTFHDDPAAFLGAAGEHLAADPVLANLVTTVAERSVREDAVGLPHGLPHRWWATVHDDGVVVGVAMRTAPFDPFPVYLLPMPECLAIELARSVHARGERVTGVNGALPAAEAFAAETARLAGGTPVVRMRTRLHRLDDLVVPAPAPGWLRVVRPDEVGTALAWFEAFARDADEQAGRPPDTHRGRGLTEEQLLRRIADRHVWWWEDPAGTPVHVSGTNPPAFGTVRIGPVYTPQEHRGRGYAGNAVAQLSAQVLTEGHVPCLFTDQANPLSNRLYGALGYRPVTDMVEMLLE